MAEVRARVRSPERSRLKAGPTGIEISRPELAGRKRMVRIKPLTREEAPEEARQFFDQDERAFGFVLNPTGVLAYRPPIQGAARALGRSVSKDGVLSDGLRALVCVRVASLVGCPF